METNIAGEVKEFRYVRNHHYLSLKALDGEEADLFEHGVIRYFCRQCNYRWWAEDNRSNVCPVCRNADIEQQWMRPQVGLLPEKETGFKLVRDMKKNRGG